MRECVFCAIIRGEAKSEILCQNDRAVAFRDIHPQAPSHVLVVPRKHISSLREAEEQDRDLLGHLLLMAREVSRVENIGDGFRIVINSGARAGQSVDHIHLHVLGGRVLRWPPG
ncbi:MAG: histidine triad nucleotide-binding protein [Acidobacteriota bacterium]